MLMSSLIPLMLLLALFAGAAIPAAATAADPLEQKADALGRRALDELGIPGLSIAVVRQGEVVLARGYGQANVEHDVAAKPETVYLLASITKTFTATAIMMLVEEGKLGLDDPIGKHLEEVPAAWEGITVRHLLTHTAGLRDRFEGRKSEDWLLSFTTAEMYRAARATPIDSSPGERWQYSDQGYFLLGMILERVSGKSYREFLTERIFRPLGMEATTTVRQADIVKNLASGYTREGELLQHNHRRTDYGLVSHFGILSTVLDLAKWDAALDGERLLKRATLERMWQTASLKDGTPMQSPLGPYGIGWFLGERNGHRIVQHGGATGTAFWRLPDDHLTVIVLTNLEMLAGGDATGIAKKIAALYAPDASWAAMKAVTDPAPATTESIRAELLRLAEGKPDLTRYAPTYGPLVKGAIQGQVEFFRAIGPLKEFVYLGRSEAGKGPTRFYRAVHRDVTLHYEIGLDADGKINGIVGEPAESD
jgi:CubicO group peptidase (beta-lactamase class C family)